MIFPSEIVVPCSRHSLLCLRRHNKHFKVNRTPNRILYASTCLPISHSLSQQFAISHHNFDILSPIEISNKSFGIHSYCYLYYINKSFLSLLKYIQIWVCFLKFSSCNNTIHLVRMYANLP